jgi:polyribonucleotide nucleotidyltransferase
MSDKEHPGMHFFPLSVEFEEKFYAAGQILGNRFQRREGRPSDEAVLSARIVDRTIRPLFNQRIRRDVQVVITVLAIGDDDPDVLGVIGASLALSVSDIPWAGPVGAVRIGKRIESGELVINPTYTERVEGLLDIEVLACGQEQTINMIETAAHEASDEEIMSMLELATSEHKKIEAFQAEVVAAIGKTKQVLDFPTVPEAISKLFETEYAGRLTETIFSGRAGKSHIYDLKQEFLTAVTDLEEDHTTAGDFFEDKIDAELHRGAIVEQKRADGRPLNAVRELYAEVGNVSPVLHGSGIFYRGGTHIFSALTLGGPEAAQYIDTIESPDTKKHFLHHYNFPPYSVGETGRIGGFNRRMIGHGALAEKALAPMIPNQDTFPYTIRVVSETLSSNGSSSMGSVCAATLALMDGGVPIIRPVAGIASGVMIDETDYALLTDIQGPEDEFGDMDFKVAGTSEGITAIQMDVKVAGIPLPVLKEALAAAKAARLTILETMLATIPAPRESISPRAPEILSLQIDPDQIGLVIGSGGKTVNAIKEETGVEEISIEDDGTVYITGRNGSAAKAKERIAALTKEYSVGEQVTVTVTKITDFGAFAALDTYNEGLIHISEIAPFRLETMDGVLSVGEKLPVEVIKIDNGKIGLSIKKVDPDFAQKRGLKSQT